MPKCLLLSLPPEIRNYIHELVFASPSTADFVEARPPPKDLIMTCRQISAETSRMYKAAYRSFWSTTKFVVDVFDDQIIEAQSTVSGQATWSLSEDKKARVYAKVQELDDEDLARMTNIHIRSEKEHHYWTLGDPSSDTWSLHFPAPNDPNHRCIDLFLPINKTAALEKAGFEVTTQLWTPRLYTTLIVHGWEDEEVEKARRIIGRTGLSKEELMCPIRTVCRDDSQACR